MLAAKHFDPVLGIDIHIVLIPSPAGPIPTPVPHPFVGVMFDPKDYIPMSGATVLINGLPRATAGSAVKALPHVPMGGPFLKPPGNEGELFMGSSTVLVEGEPMGYSGLPVLSCQDIGMPAPKRKKGKPSTSLMLPTSTVMCIPTGAPVLIGGAPTITMSSATTLLSPLAKRMKQTLHKSKKLAGPLAKLDRKAKGSARYLNSRADKVFDKLGLSKEGAARNAVSRHICTVTGHPVDVATGKLFTEFVDFELHGALPYKLERVWYSTSQYHGPLGHGWHASFDMALVEDDDVIGVRLDDGRVALFPAIVRDDSFYSLQHSLTLHRETHGYRISHAASGLTHHFAAVPGRKDKPLVAIEDRHGNQIQLRYDPYGRLLSIIDAGARAWTFSYDRADRITEVTGPHPDKLDERIVHGEYLYDGRGNLSEVRDALGHAQKFKYERHLLVRETLRSGLSFYFEYDGADDRARCIRTWGDGGIYDHKLTYDPHRQLTTVENSLGHKTQYEHDGAMVHRTLDAFGNIKQTSYGTGYRVLSETDELGQTSRYQYDDRGNLIETFTPDGAIVKLEYDAQNLPIRVTDALGGSWLYKRDARGRVVECIDPLERVTRYAYQGRWLVGVYSPSGVRTTLGYGASGQLDSIATGDSGLTRLQCDRLGRLTSTVDPDGNARRVTLDVLGRALRVEEPDGNVRELRYDAEGNVVQARDKQHDVRFSYQGMSRVASRSEAGTTVKFQYDTEEQLTAIVNEHGAVYRFKLGPTGHVDEEHGFDGLLRKYTRDRAGRVTRVDRPGDRYSEYKHDPLGRVRGVEHWDGTKERYAYSLDRALSAATNDDVAVLLERDLLGRVLREEQGEHTVDSVYDLQGRRVRMRSSLGADQTIERNALGDVVRVAEASSQFEARFHRDQLGRELQRALPGGLTSRWRRDNTGRPTQHMVGTAEQTLRAVGYRWEVNDRLQAVLDGLNGPTEYRHDALGNLAWAGYPDGTAELRMPDAVGNLFKTEQRGDRKYGPAGQLLSSWTPQGETRYAYDAEGNLTEKREPSGRTWRYAWNAAGMLSQVTRPDGSAVTFAYDALGRRVRKTYRGQSTRWVWDGNVPLHEWVEGRLQTLDVAGGVPWATSDEAQRRRVAELDALIAQDAAKRGTRTQPITWLFEPEGFAPMGKLCNGEEQSIVCDYLGTPVLMADAQGQRVWRAGLSAWGELRELEGERFACPFRWPGQYEDVETGLYYNRFRYYDAEGGQYVSQDPIGLAGGAAVYAYVHDPLGWVDPVGLSGCRDSPSLEADELRNRSRTEIAQLATRKGLIPTGTTDSATGLTKRWKDPVTGKERLRLDRGHVDRKTGLPYDNPRAAVDHVHGLKADGKTKIRDPLADGDPHFPTRGD